MRYTMILMAALMTVLAWNDQARSEDIDTLADNYVTEQASKGDNEAELTGERADFITKYATDANQRAKTVYVGATKQELLRIWSGSVFNPDITTSAIGTVLSIEYVVPEEIEEGGQNPREIHRHFIYSLFNDVITKIDVLDT